MKVAALEKANTRLRLMRSTLSTGSAARVSHQRNPAMPRGAGDDQHPAERAGQQREADEEHGQRHRPDHRAGDVERCLLRLPPLDAAQLPDGEDAVDDGRRRPRRRRCTASPGCRMITPPSTGPSVSPRYTPPTWSPSALPRVSGGIGERHHGQVQANSSAVATPWSTRRSDEHRGRGGEGGRQRQDGERRHAR